MKTRFLRDYDQKKYKRFSIAEDGSYVRDRWTGEKLIPYLNGGYMVISITINGIYYHSIKISHLQWLAWRGPISKGNEIHHNGRDKDGKYDKTNDHIDNLILCETRKEHFELYHSGKDASCFGRTGEKNPMFGRTGKDHPTFGRTGEKNPMFGRTGENHPMFGKRGEDAPHSTLDNEKIERIKYLRFVKYWSQGRIAKEIGVVQSCICAVVNGTSWNKEELTKEELKSDFLATLSDCPG